MHNLGTCRWQVPDFLDFYCEADARNTLTPTPSKSNGRQEERAEEAVGRESPRGSGDSVDEAPQGGA